jgi:DNA-binding CsgD family transcriptional regulator
MERLTAPDLRAFLKLLQRIYALGDLNAFRTRALSGLLELLPGEFAGYSEMYPAESRSGGDWSDPAGVYNAHLRELWEQHMHEHPILAHYLKTGDGGARRISDFLTQRQYHQLGLYNEIYRQMGVEDELGFLMRASPELLVGLAVHRDRNFTDRERLLLDLLRPHLQQARENAASVDRLRNQTRLLSHALETVEARVIIIEANGRARLMTPAARRSLAEYYGQLCSGTQIPDDLRRWIAHQRHLLSHHDDAPQPLRPLVIERAGKRLRGRLIPSLDELLVLLEEDHTPAPALLESFGLTRREAEILSWVAEGKTNCEIGVILSISDRTVGKHLERIYQKLGVENRTAAAARALEVRSAPTR